MIDNPTPTAAASTLYKLNPVRLIAKPSTAHPAVNAPAIPSTTSVIKRCVSGRQRSLARGCGIDKQNGLPALDARPDDQLSRSDRYGLQAPDGFQSEGVPLC
jgi:hypothetical protein